GLPATLAAARAGKDVMLANKEALVVSGALFMKAMVEGGGRLLPIDSEHSAVFQSLPRGFACGREGELERAGVRRILLTASGGPFRTTPVDRLARVTPQQACANPNWVMGRKISVDFTTMGELTFERPDPLRFPCVRLAAEAMRSGGTAPAALNAANEIAVESFLAGQIAFTAIPEVIESVLAESSVEPLVSLEQAYAADLDARAAARRLIARRPRMLA